MYEWKIVRERRSGYGVRRRMRSSGDIYESFKDHFARLDREHFVVLLLDAKNAMLGFHTVSIGSLTSSLFAALRALRATTEAPVPAAPPPPPVDMPSQAAPITPERATGLARPVPVPSAHDHARAVRQWEALRAQKQAVLAQRKRITVARTLAGNPGQLNLFGEE